MRHQDISAIFLAVASIRALGYPAATGNTYAGIASPGGAKMEEAMIRVDELPLAGEVKPAVPIPPVVR